MRRNLVSTFFCILSFTAVSYAQDLYFACDGSALSATNKWSTTQGGPYSLPFVAGRTARFAVVNGTGTGGTISVVGIIASENFTISSASGTLGTAGQIAGIDVATGKVLDLNSQSISTTSGTGFIKNGNGVLAIIGSTYNGGFTLNSGVVVLRGINALGTNAVILNAGIVASNGTRDLTGKYTGITLGGNIQFGALSTSVSLANDVAGLTITSPISLGSATRKITIGNNGTVTFEGTGAFSGGVGAGIEFDRLPGVTGKIVLNRTGGNTLSPGLNAKLTSGIVDINTNQTINDFNLSGGTLTVGPNVVLTINGKLSVNSSATLVLGTNASIVYGPNSSLEYIGSGNRTVGIEWPAIDGPAAVTVNTGDVVSLNGSRTLQDLTLTSGDLSIGSNTLTLNRSFTGSTLNNLIGSKTANLVIGSTFNAATGSGILMDQTVSNGNFLNSAIFNNGVGIINTLKIAPSTSATTGFIQVNGGSVNAGGNLVLTSDATGTARVAPSTGSIISNITVERFIPARRAWRLITAPVSNGGSVFANWQNNGTVITSTGSEIWGPTGGNPVNSTGLANGPSFSMRKYDPLTNTMVAVTDTKLEPLSTSGGTTINNQSFFTFVTGPFANGAGNIASTSGAAATTLKAMGLLQNGTQTVPLNIQRLTLFGNPFASPVDFRQILANTANYNGTACKIKSRFWFWDPVAAPFGGYKLVYKYTSTVNGVTTTSYKMLPANPYLANSSSAVDAGDYAHIQSGQAVFIETKTIGTTSSIEIRESDKSSVQISPSATIQTFRTAALGQDFGISLFKDNELVDGALVQYGSDFSNDILDEEDAGKPSNTNENLAIRKGGRTLMLESHPASPVANDTIFLWTFNTVVNQTYKLVLNTTDLSLSNYTAVLEDVRASVSTPLNMNGLTEYTYSALGTGLNSDVELNRFRVVFKPIAAVPLPVTFTKVQAAKQGTAVQVRWSVANEATTVNYEVEKSVDAQRFVKLAEVAARNLPTASYSVNDMQPASGVNYYRIKALENNGATRYSQVVKVDLDHTGKSQLTVYPNPVRGKTLTIQLKSDQGVYDVEFVNGAGQIVMRQSINHAGGSTSEVVALPQGLAMGVYSVRVKNSTTSFETSFILQ